MRAQDRKASHRKLSIYAKIVLLVFGWTLLAFSASAALAQCPSPEKIVDGFMKVFRKNVKVLKVKPSPVSGLCEVQINAGGRNSVLYTDAAGNYFLAGQLLDVQTGVNLTQEVSTDLNRMAPEEIKKLDSLTAFTLGNAGKVLYLATDPQCPFCKTALEMVKKLVNEQKLTVKVLLYPLAMHKGADEQCVSILCDNKGLEGLEQGYKSENQCAEGVKKVKDTIAFFQERTLTGVPVFIFADGLYHTGVLPEEMLRKQIEPSRPVPAQPAPQPKQ